MADVPIFWKTTDALAQNTIDIIDMELRFSVSGLWCWLQLTGKVTKRNEKNEILECLSLMSVALNNIETIINWYDEYPSETCIIMEDDISLANIKYWNFD